jgi:hypothetical protein
MTDGIQAQAEKRGRDIILYTGMRGMELINEELEKEAHRFVVENLIDATDWLLEKKVVTLNEHENLVNMLKSPDHENFELAKLIIQNYKDEYNIQRGRPQLQKPRYHR